MAQKSKTFPQDMQVRTASVPRRSLGVLSAVVKDSGLTFNGKRPTQESIINAAWVALAALPEAEMVRLIGEGMAQMEAQMGLSAEPAPPADPSLVAAQDLPLPGDPDAEPKRPGPKRGPGRARRQG